MEDIKIAKKILLEENMTLVIVKNEKVIYKSKEKGIKPLYIAVTTLKETIKGSCAADRVVGKAAAWLYTYLDIKRLYCEIISKEGKKKLIEKNIGLEFTKEVEYIKNRTKTDMCPVEKISKDENDFDNLLINIRKFLESIKSI